MKMLSRRAFACKLSSQSGSILTAALGVTLLVGTLSYTTYSLLSGPVRSAAVVTLKTKAQNELILGAKLLMRAAADTDGVPDGVTEPPGATADAAVASTNGGLIPNTIGAEKIDPWRTPYAYCGWDHGTSNTGIAGLIDGAPAGYDALMTMALISAGPDRVFQTVCSPAGILTTGGDDIVMRYTYEQATNIELWKESGGVGLETSNAMQNVGIGKAADPALKLDVLGDSKLTGNLVVDTGTFTAGTVDINGGTIDNVAIAGSTINNSTIGATTQSSGAFTTLNANAGTTTVGLTGTGVTTLSGSGTINGISIGATTASTGRFSNLTWTGTMTPPNTTLVANLNADLLDGNDGSFYQDASNLNAGTLDVARTPAYQGDVSKVAGDDYTFVEALQGYAVDLSNAPTANTVLGWDSSNNVWKAMAVETGVGGPGTVGVSGVNYLATAAAITSGNCSDGQVPKLVSGAWECSPDVSGSLTLPINSDNATSPSGQIISGTVSAVVESFLRFKNNGVFLGSRAGKNSSGDGNVMMGLDAGITTSTGARNTMLGTRAGEANTTQADGVYIGYEAGRYFLTAGASSNNVMIGSQAGLGVNGTSTGASNTFIGSQAGKNTTVGWSNVYVGALSGGASPIGTNTWFYSNASSGTDTGAYNTAVGSYAGGSLTSGRFNTLMGLYAGIKLSTPGSSAADGTTDMTYRLQTNTFVGTMAGMNISTGNNNTFVGGDAGGRLEAASSDNTYVGSNAGRGPYGTPGISRTGSTMIGSFAGYQTKAADNNVFIGRDAGRASFTPANSIYIGYQAGRNYEAGSHNIFIGEGSGYGVATTSTGANNIFLGQRSGEANTTGANSVYIGNTAGRYFIASNNIFIGNAAGLGVAGSSTGGNNIFIGASAGSATTSQTSSVYIGTNAGRYNIPAIGGANNVYIGNNAGLGTAGSSTGNSNTYVGASAGAASTTATNNATFGTSAGAALTSGDYNTMVGSAAGLVNQTGQLNAFFGNNAGRNFSSSNNTFIGASAGFGVNGSSSGTGNTALGRQAGTALTTGNNNLLLGASAGANLDVGAGNIIIGSGSAPAANTNNYLLIYGGGGDVLRGTMNSGNLSAQGAALGFHSDSRLKNDIETVENVVDSLAKIRGVTFKWNGLTNQDTESTQYGVIAQEVEKVFPHLVTLGPVSGNGKRYLEVAYNGFIPILIEAVKQQQHEIEARDAQISKMQSDIDELKQAVKALQAAK